MLSLVYGGVSPANGADRTDDIRAQGYSEAAAGWRLLKTGDTSGAALAFSRALNLIPGEPSFYVGLGTAYVRLRKEEEAEPLFRRAIELDPNATKAHALLGDLSARKDEWQEAIEHYRIAVRLDPNDVSLESRFRTARQHHGAEAGFDRLYTAHFVVKFNARIDRAPAREAADRLELAYRDIGQRFGYFPAKSTVAVLYPNRRFQESAMGPEWAGGLFDGILRMPADNLRHGRAEAERSLRHEYTHALVHELAGGNAPAWLSEGLAQVFEGRTVPAANGFIAGDPDTLNRLQLLHGSFADLTRETAEQAYVDSQSATHALIVRHGMPGVRALLAALADQPDFDRTFERVLHERYRDFEAAWMDTHGERRF